MNQLEQATARIEALEAEIARIREAASVDLQNLQNDIIGKNRELGRLKAELVKTSEQEPEHDDVTRLLRLWKVETGRNAKTDIKAGSKRYKLASAAVKRWGAERSTNAIRGLALKPYSGPRGRSHECYLGAKKIADVEHALGDEVRMERCEAYWLEHLTPTLESPVLELAPPAAEPEFDMRKAVVIVNGVPLPESPERQALRDLYGSEDQLKHKPAASERRRPEPPWDDRPPIDKVLGSLSQAGCAVKTGSVDSWSAQCPAHEDRDPSLSVHRKADGTVLLHCWAGCDTADVLAELRLEWRDLWTGGERDFDRADGDRVRRVPAHLRHAMERLLEREAAA